MIRDIIVALIGNYMITAFVIGVVVGVIQIALHRGSARSEALISGTMLNAFVFWAVGIGQAINFVMHSVLGDYAATSIGWAQSPFQLELAFSSLGVAVIAFIVHGKRAQFRSKVAVVLATVIFNYGAAAGHIYQMVAHHDFAVNNTGLLLFTDLFVPTVGLIFVIWHGIVLRVDRADANTDMTVANTTLADTTVADEPVGQHA